MTREKKKIEPSFNDGLILHLPRKTEDHSSHHHGLGDAEKEWKSYYHIYSVSKRERSKGPTSSKATRSCQLFRRPRRLAENSTKEAETLIFTRIRQQDQPKAQD